MYALGKSLLEPAGEYRVEMYAMEVFGYEAHIHIELKIFGEGSNESYIGHFEIERADGKAARGACMNRSTKEETFIAVEEAVMEMLEDENQYWR